MVKGRSFQTIGELVTYMQSAGAGGVALTPTDVFAIYFDSASGKHVIIHT
jgi:hypothetical protein